MENFDQSKIAFSQKLVGGLITFELDYKNGYLIATDVNEKF